MRVFFPLAVFFSLFPGVLFAEGPAKSSGESQKAPASTTASFAAPQIAPDAETPYILGPQNVIQIKIFGESGVNPIYRIDELGFIKHALVGRLKLGGLNVEQAEELLEKTLAGDYIINPQVTIFVLEHSRFSIIGEVRKPGTYEILGRVSIIEAISMAGGFTPVANQRDVRIQRRQEEAQSTVQVDTTKITQRGDMTAQVNVEANDVIVVAKSFF